MQLSDEERLLKELIGTAEAMGHALTPNAAAMMASDLEGVPFEVVKKALSQIRNKYKGRLTFPVIRERIEQSDGRPEPNEAWAIAAGAADERDSVVWTQEIAMAFDSVRHVLQNDKVAARMSFLTTYARLLETARDTRTPAEWSLSAGWDGERRHLAIEQAVRLERLPMPQALALGYEPGDRQATVDGQALQLLLAGPSHSLIKAIADDRTREALAEDEAREVDKLNMPRGVSPEMRQKLRALRADVAEHSRQRAELQQHQRQAQRTELQARKDAATAAVRAHQGESTSG